MSMFLHVYHWICPIWKNIYENQFYAYVSHREALHSIGFFIINYDASPGVSIEHKNIYVHNSKDK